MCICLCAARFLQRPLAKLISGLRAPKSSEGYKRIGGGSPLRRITEQQADALAHALKREGLDAKVYVGMRYWAPFIEDAMEEVGFVDADQNEVARTVFGMTGLFESMPWCMWAHDTLGPLR